MGILYIIARQTDLWTKELNLIEILILKGIQKKFNLYIIIKDDETLFSTKFYLQRFESANAITEKE